MKRLSFDDRLVLVPKLGMVLTVCSRLLDSLENLWVILIYSNPDSYPTALISLMNTTQSAKWLVVTIEYPTLGLAIVLVLLVRFTSLFDGKTPRFDILLALKGVTRTLCVLVCPPDVVWRRGFPKGDIQVARFPRFSSTLSRGTSKVAVQL